MHYIQKRREETSSCMVSNIHYNLHITTYHIFLLKKNILINNRCDRIIWSGNGLKQHEYTRGETKISDHRPVKAIFTAEVTVIRRGKKIRNFFFSDRFEDTIDVDSKDYSWIST